MYFSVSSKKRGQLTQSRALRPNLPASLIFSARARNHLQRQIIAFRLTAIEAASNAYLVNCPAFYPLNEVTSLSLEDPGPREGACLDSQVFWSSRQVACSRSLLLCVIFFLCILLLLQTDKFRALGQLSGLLPTERGYLLLWKNRDLEKGPGWTRRFSGGPSRLLVCDICSVCCL